VRMLFDRIGEVEKTFPRNGVAASDTGIRQDLGHRLCGGDGGGLSGGHGPGPSIIARPTRGARNSSGAPGAERARRRDPAVTRPTLAARAEAVKERARPVRGQDQPIRRARSAAVVAAASTVTNRKGARRTRAGRAAPSPAM